MFTPPQYCSTFVQRQTRQYSSRMFLAQLRTSIVGSRSSSFQSTGVLHARRRKDFFTSNASPRLAPAEEKHIGHRQVEPTLSSKRRSTRPPAATHSLRRVALEAQRSRDSKDQKKTYIGQEATKSVTAICAAQEYDIAHIAEILQGYGNQIDPYGTELYPQVVHVALPFQTSPSEQNEPSPRAGDLFVFPSGTVVAWDIPDTILSSLVSVALLPAAKSPLERVEEEDLEYTEDATRDTSNVRGDRINLGTRPQRNADGQASQDEEATPNPNLDTVLAKIAFSSGLARSTKLAVLESLLSDYFESTRSIPEVLSRGGRMPFTRSFISQKTGQLLSIRAQLNLYSELTDSLPDLFWDSRHELGLEGYFDQVSKALDTNIRIKVLNEKMDYAQEIASVLRQQLSEKHGVRLEWIIILLIAIEVLFAIDKEVKEFRERAANAAKANIDVQ